MRCTSVQRGDVGKREATLREEPRLAFPLLLFPHTGGRSAVPHGKGSSTHKKTPTLNGRGQPIQAAAPFPRKDVSAPCRAGLLARGILLLSAPSQGQRPQWSPQISIRLQLRGSDGFAPSSLATISDCGQPYQRHIQFYIRAYGSAPSFVKNIFGGSRVTCTSLEAMGEESHHTFGGGKTERPIDAGAITHQDGEGCDKNTVTPRLAAPVR